MNITVLDFETYYDHDFSLKKLTIPQYVHDPRFHVHGVAIYWPEGHSEFRTDVTTALAELQARFGPDLVGTTIVCHHAHFDLYILNHKYGIKPRFFTDTLALAHHVNGRRDHGSGEGASLKALADHYDLEAKGDLGFMVGVRNPDARQLADLVAYARHDTELTAKLAEVLLPKVSRPEVELPRCPVAPAVCIKPLWWPAMPIRAPWATLERRGLGTQPDDRA
jgi:DNA polymerase bacteriophage-type